MTRIDRRLKRELESPDEPAERHRGPAMRPTAERAAKLRVQLQRVAQHLAAESRIVPRLEEMYGQKRISQNMLVAARYYACLAFIADGPSQGVGRYGDWQQSSPAWQRMITSDDRMRARRLFDAARLAVFGIRDRDGRWAIDEAARHAIEPILLGDDACMTITEVGRFLSIYKSRSGVSAAGATEVYAALRRLRLFFRMGDD